MKTSIASRSRQASIAAEPVSPDVAPTMVTRRRLAFGIGPASEGLELRLAKLRPSLRHIEAPVAGEPGQQDLIEAQNRGFAPGRHVTQRRSLGSKCRRD